METKYHTYDFDDRFYVGLLTSLAPRAHGATCSTSTVAGNWAATLSGVLILPTGQVPVAAVIKLRQIPKEILQELKPGVSAAGTPMRRSAERGQ